MTDEPAPHTERSLADVFHGRTPAQPLVAASSPMIPPTAPAVLTPQALRARTQGWQRRIIELSQLVPEVAGAASLVRGSVSRVEWIVEGGNPSDRARLQEQIDALDVGRAAELIWLSGEVYIAAPRSGPFYSLSVTETKFDDARKREMRGPNSWLPMLDRFERIWKPSLYNRWHATSPNQAAMDVIEAMYLHQLADGAVATSRLAGAGIVVWPTSLPDMPNLEDGTPAPGSRQAMLKEFHDAAWQSIKNREGKDAHIPFVVFVDPEQGDWEPKLFRIDRDDHAEQYAVRFAEYRRRYAHAVDLPVETVAGSESGQSHWNAWAVKESEWRYYLSPLIEILRDGIERRILAPLGMRLSVDPKALIEKPDPTATVLRLLQLGVIEPEYAFEMLGYDPSRSREIPQRAYATSQMEAIPAEFSVGGERGGGQVPE